jgi:CRP-like cAMP-binding protein
MLGVLEKVLVLRDSSLFTGLSGEELYPVAEIAQAALFSPGDFVVRQGDPGDALFVVASGTFQIEKDETKLRELGVGATFGELALLDGAPRAASVVAVTDGQLLRIPRAEFEALLDESPELARGVIRTLVGHLRGGK